MPKDHDEFNLMVITFTSFEDEGDYVKATLGVYSCK